MAFELDKTVEAGATQVKGRGPAGVPVMIVDITLGGNVLGTGTIGSDGTFVVDLYSELESLHRIGLALANLAGTQWDEMDFRDERYFGSLALNVPQVGFFYDTHFISE